MANTPGMLDGQIHFWRNRVSVGQYASGFGSSPAEETGAPIVNWNPTYGGVGPAVLSDQLMWPDHVYMSGRN